jgi:DNA-binding transcriptional regulator YiaG
MPTEASSETAPEESLAGAAAEEISPLSPGQMLSAARVQQNLTQREVAETLHITMHYVNAIEHDEHDKLPGPFLPRVISSAMPRLWRLTKQR